MYLLVYLISNFFNDFFQILIAFKLEMYVKYRIYM